MFVIYQKRQASQIAKMGQNLSSTRRFEFLRKIFHEELQAYISIIVNPCVNAIVMDPKPKSSTNKNLSTVQRPVSDSVISKGRT